MKTLKDLEQMKTQICISFDTQYDLFFSRLKDYFVSKSDGATRIVSELKEWDDESQKVITKILIANILKSGVTGLNELEITSRLRMAMYIEGCDK